MEKFFQIHLEELTLWLLSECKALSNIFSKEDLKNVPSRMNRFFESTSLAKEILNINIHKSIETAVKLFLSIKKAVMTTPVGTGINYAFSAFQRSESIFIDTEEYFSNNTQRLEAVKRRLEEEGHYFTVIRGGDVPLIKIDNFLYEALTAAEMQAMPIHGVRLRKYPLY